MTVALAALEQGESHGKPPIVILHGLFGSARNWQSIARDLAATRHVIAFDLRNHGASPWAATMSYQEMAWDVEAALRSRGITSPAVLGHSMGGKVAMLMALSRPEMVERLVIVDIAPTAHEPIHQPLIDAMQGVDLTDRPRRAQVEERLRGSIPDPGVRLFLLQNLVTGEDGALRWRINLDAIEQSLPELSSFPAIESGRHYDGPTLVIAGALSTYIKAGDRPAFARLFPASRIVAIPAAGHWVHAEQPGSFLAAVAPFLGVDSDFK